MTKKTARKSRNPAPAALPETVKKSSPPTSKSCTSCIFARGMQFDPDRIYCQRYPISSRAYKTHWCGEYKA